MTTSEKSANEQRIATLNIRHGGKKHADALTARLLGLNADVLIVTEFRPNDAGVNLMSRLSHAGYSTSHPGGNGARNAVLIALRHPIDRSWALDEALDTERLRCVETGGTVICAALFPQKDQRHPHWEAVINAARLGGVDLSMGDFNTDDNALDKDPKGAPIVNADIPRYLIDSGYVDLWRSRHPGVREYTWYSHTKNSFRLDHAFAVPEMASRVPAGEFDHEPRLLGETDHSALAFSITSTCASAGGMFEDMGMLGFGSSSARMSGPTSDYPAHVSNSSSWGIPISTARSAGLMSPGISTLSDCRSMALN